MAIAITSGKGGVGKTNITSNLGIELAKNGHKVCIFDADTSLANINILLGLTPEFTLEQFLNGEKSIEDILLTGPEGVKVVPSASGIAELADLQPEQQSRIVEALRTLEQQFNYILVDTAAGISENVIRFLQSAQYAVVVISPEPTSLTDAFSLIKVLQRRNYDKPIYTLVNMAKNYKHSMDVFKRFSHAVNKYVHLKIRYLGYIPMDSAMRNAVATQSPVVINEPRSPAARCISLLTQILLKHFKATPEPGQGISDFWRSQTTDNESEADSNKSTSTQIEPSHNNMHIIEAQKLKEVNRILELTTDALSNKDFNQQQAETLLASTLKNHLEQFGTLPASVMELLPDSLETTQPHPQKQAEINAAADSESNPLVENIKPANLTTETTSTVKIAAGREPEASESATQATLNRASPINALKEEIDSLVNDAIRTKKELSELTTYLKEQYRALYNSDQLFFNNADHTPPASNLTSARPQNRSTEDQQSLKQSIRYASAVDQKG